MPIEDSNESFLETMMENFGFLDLDDLDNIFRYLDLVSIFVKKNGDYLQPGIAIACCSLEDVLCHLVFVSTLIEEQGYFYRALEICICRSYYQN